MPSDYARRGRPRGSGLDDRDQLRRIAKLLEADPALKPTTAIKALGVSDPSSIRRLRDKLKTTPNGADKPAHVRDDLAAPSTVRLAGAQNQPVSPKSSNAAGAGAGALAEFTPFTGAQMSWLAEWCAIGLSAMCSTLEAQMTMMNDLVRNPQVESALRHQLLFNDVAKAFCPKRSDIRSTTLH